MYYNPVFVSRVKQVIVAFTLFLAFFVSKAQAAAPVDSVIADTVVTAENDAQHHGAANHEAKKEEKGFDITSFIFHHISDSHYFTLFGHGEHGIHLHLPIILWTDKGLVTFSSKEFNFNDDGTVAVEKNGQRFAMAHNKIYYANETADAHGSFVSHELNDKGDEVVTNARPLDFSITKNVFSMLLSIVVLVILFTAAARGYKKREGKAPKGIQSFMEPIILFVRDDIARPNLGHKYAKFMPYLLTVFFFIWFNNMLGLVPFFPGGANVTGNIAMTAVLAACTYLITTFKGNKDYWKHIFWMPGVPVPMKIFLAPLELIGTFTKPIALAIRLFANITAGHILVMSLLCLIFIFNSIAVAPASIFFAVFIGLIEFLVAFIQAFIFTTLSALFIGMAVEEHH